MDISEKQVGAVRASELGQSHSWDDPSEFADLALELLEADAEEVQAWEAEQGKGAYSVIIRGVPGAYFVEAMEFDNDGVYDTLEEAEAAAMSAHGDFLIFDDDLEDGQEKCPICEAVNYPGAMEYCEHYAGANVEGAIDWLPDGAEPFWALVEEFVELCHDLSQLDDATVKDAAATEVGASGFYAAALELGDDLSPYDLVRLLPFVSGSVLGDEASIGGMAQTFYTRVPSRTFYKGEEEAIFKVTELLRKLRTLG